MWEVISFPVNPAAPAPLFHSDASGDFVWGNSMVSPGTQGQGVWGTEKSELVESVVYCTLSTSRK